MTFIKSGELSLEQTLFGDITRQPDAETRELALEIGHALLKKFDYQELTPADLTMVEFEEAGKQEHAVTAVCGSGLQIGSWSDIYELDNPLRFTIPIRGKRLDTRKLTQPILQAVHDQQIAAGKDPSSKVDGIGARWTHGMVDLAGNVSMNMLYVERYQGETYVDVGTMPKNKNDARITFSPTIVLSDATVL